MTEINDLFRQKLDALERAHATNGSSWLLRARREAFGRFEARGFPSLREEAWKYTDVAPLARIPFRRAEPVEVRLDEIEKLLLLDPKEIRLVFIDGRFDPALSSMSELPSGVRVENLESTLHSGDGVLRDELGCHLGELRTHPFAELNTAVSDDGLLVVVPRGVVVEAPIHAIFVTTDQAEPTASHPRSLILVEEGASATIIEEYVSFGEGPRFTNPVLECRVGDGGALDHYRVVREGEGTFHISAIGGTIARDAKLRSFSFVFGGRLVRNDVEVRFVGENGEATLNGLAVAGGERHVDNHTRIVHSEPHCRSWEVYKTILADRATGVFNGQIYVDPKAQKTDAKQTNQSLLLSRDATMNSKPELEIYADDVRCTHGATIGQLEEEALFYLRSRGLGLEDARNLLILAFASDIVADVRVRVLEERLKSEIFAQLSKEVLAGAS